MPRPSKTDGVGFLISPKLSYHILIVSDRIGGWRRHYQFHIEETIKLTYRAVQNMWVEYDEYNQVRYRFQRDHILTRDETPSSMWTDEYSDYYYYYYDSDFPTEESVYPP